MLAIVPASAAVEDLAQNTVEASLSQEAITSLNLSPIFVLESLEILASATSPISHAETRVLLLSFEVSIMFSLHNNQQMSSSYFEEDSMSTDEHLWCEDELLPSLPSRTTRDGSSVAVIASTMFLHSRLLYEDEGYSGSV